MSIQVIVNFNVKKDKLNEFLKIMENLKIELPKVDGCDGIKIFEGENDKQLITLLESWENIEKHKLHIATVVESGGWDFICSFLDASPTSSYVKEI